MSSASSDSPPAPDCVKHHPCELPTTCQPPLAWGEQEGWPGLITDVSHEGLSLSLKRRFERGAGLSIELPAGAGSSTVLARVVGITARPEGRWELACSLLSALSDEEIEALLAIDRARRAPAPVDGVLFQVALRPGEVLRWFVKRLNLPGAWPLERGRLIGLQFEDTPAGAFPIELQVRHCRRQADHWVVNGHFTVVPEPAVLRALGQPVPS